MLRSGLVTVCALALCSCNVFMSLDGVEPPCQGTTWPVEVTGAYLYADPGDDVEAPLILELAELGIMPGDEVSLDVRGGYRPSRAGDPVLEEMGAVFSASDELLEASEPHRVIDAIAAGMPVESRPTFREDEPTDIPEDFLADGATVVVPEDATHLFAAALDSLYEDNLELEDEPFELHVACPSP